ncbi:Rv0340 family IniB-related protein [Mycobacterium seoulense]|uniref:Uncharacterized protein n=1 Tax=Mycobacterium seoulense TaxID=386911 RepID=A0A7I7P5I1_9MYCO|nr:IniB N-terminal domain-containing protein [Mycobacterium seoulense]MCV7438888.1 hypothetical protein [Mycobacterium seoulense]BBY03949.1 hypothetical protein MSEO_44480 [Mycobacterium seoulense]
MANALLDFVMSLVRDPQAAARYAADPAQAIAEAHLTGVTSADVNHLIPMVSDSLSMSTPGGTGGTTEHGNVWASGAATAAFDAFPAHAPVQDSGGTDGHGLTGHVIDHPPVGGGGEAPGAWTDPNPAPLELHDPSATIAAPDEMPDQPVHDGGFGMDGPVGWDHSVADSHPVENEHHGFDPHFG